MHGLLDVATVLRGDGNWTSGFETDALACGREITAIDVCTPGDIPEPDQSMTGYAVDPFVIYGRQKFGAMCGPDTAEREITRAVEDATEFFVARNFWDGAIPDWPGGTDDPGDKHGGLYLEASGIESVAEGSATADTVAAVLEKAYENHPEIKPIVHLGFMAALSLGPSKMDELELEYVISQGYPKDGVAVTGPIVVHLGSVETSKSSDSRVNRFYVEATRLAAVEFDPCLAVRAGTV